MRLRALVIGIVAAVAAGPLGATAAPAAVAPQVARLTAVRAAAHPGYDRLVFEFAGPLPAVHSVTWVSRVTKDPSGLPVTLGGRALLHVVFDAATAHTGTGAPTYAGTLPTSFDLPILRSVKQAGDFENVLSFGVGLWQKSHYHAFTLTGPSRLVIDLTVTAGHPRRLTEVDNGRLVYLRVGQQTTVALRTCVSCGYSWHVAGAPDRAVVRILDASVVPLPHPSGVVGSPSESRWTLQASGVGRTTLLLYERSPAREAPPVARYLLRFTVSR